LAWPSRALFCFCVARGSNPLAGRRVGLIGLGAIDLHSADSDMLVNLDQRAVAVGLVFVFYGHLIIHPDLVDTGAVSVPGVRIDSTVQTILRPSPAEVR
jgi:hypothetical protein